MRLHRPRAKAAAALALAGVAACLAAASREGRAATKEIRRAKPPAAVWDKSTEGAFRKDAFGDLVGTRPDFSADARGETGGNDGGGDDPSMKGFRWSTLVSEQTLVDEIKDMKPPLAAAVASPSAFKGGGYDRARDAFSDVALAYGVIAAFDEEIRWKKDAAGIRDLFARAGLHCMQGSDQSFTEAKLRVADLEKLLEGKPPADTPGPTLARWSQVVARSPLMTRLGVAEERLLAATSSAADFDKAVAQLRHEAEIVAVIGEVIRQPDYELHDDDGYLGYAASMRDAAVRARDAAKEKNYEAARSAVGDLKKACVACHGDYRD